MDLGCEKNPADLRVAKVVDEQLTADLSWTSGGGEEVFIGSGPPEDEKMALNVKNQNHTLNKNILFNPSLNCQVWQHMTNTLYLLEQASFIDVGWSFFLGVAAKNDKNISPSPVLSCTIIPNQHITHAPSSPGPRYVPDQPVVSRHGSHFDRVGEAPVS